MDSYLNGIIKEIKEHKNKQKENKKHTLIINLTDINEGAKELLRETLKNQNWLFEEFICNN